MDPVARIVADFERGALTEASACAVLIELAGIGDQATLFTGLSPQLREALYRHPLIANPPASSREVRLIESVCNNGPLPLVNLERLVRQELAYRGAVTLHRELDEGRGGA